MKYELAGARGSIGDPQAILKQAQAMSAKHGAELLLADADLVFGRDHLESAVQHAVRAQSHGTMAAHSVSMEALRYLSGQRQVADAIRVAGIHQGSTATAIVIFGSLPIDEVLASFGWSRDDRVLESRGKSLDRLGIMEAELATIPIERRPDLALEKVALLALEK